jgi:hypothetical protein
MRAFEIWKDMSPSLNHEILECAYLNHKKLYKVLLEEMSANLRIRIQKLQELPRAERHTKFQSLLLLPHFDLVTQNLLLSWLASTQQEMMSAFLDELGIAHDGAGCVEEFPEKMEDAKLKKGVDTLYQKFDPEKVTIYLKAFDTVAGRTWPVAKLIREPAVS